LTEKTKMAEFDLKLKPIPPRKESSYAWQPREGDDQMSPQDDGDRLDGVGALLLAEAGGVLLNTAPTIDCLPEVPSPQRAAGLTR